MRFTDIDLQVHPHDSLIQIGFQDQGFLKHRSRITDRFPVYWMNGSDFWESNSNYPRFEKRDENFNDDTCSLDLTKAAMTYRGDEMFVGFFIDTWKLNPMKTNSRRKIYLFCLYCWISIILLENRETKTTIWLPCLLLSSTGTVHEIRDKNYSQ